MTFTILAMVLAVALPSAALNPSTEVYVPAAARVAGVAGSQWFTDLYVFNPGTSSVNVDIYFLPRDTDNSSVSPQSFTLGANETLTLPDVILGTFGQSSAAGAFRIVATGQVIANCRVYNKSGSDTFGQGLEGVPASAAVTPTNPTDIIGLTSNGTASGTFRSNIFAVNTSSSATTLDVTLMDSSGATVATKSYTLQPYAAFYKKISDLGAGNFDNGTLHVTASSGSAIVVASKNDNGSSDGTTLEGWWACGGAAGGDGTYHYAVYDSIGATGGGDIVIASDNVTAIDGMEINYEKDEDQNGESDCTVLFDIGSAYSNDFEVHALSDYASGVSYKLNYPASGSFSGGDLTFTFTFTRSGSALVGTLTAVGSNFSGNDAGCNGTFPALTLKAGIE
ncbi:MAG TPA: hypothetical protein ENK19_10485 [Acidobacteria bacterium]|nr:hypothetical protein [Acidobacteriota bacterium]